MSLHPGLTCPELPSPGALEEEAPRQHEFWAGTPDLSATEGHLWHSSGPHKRVNFLFYYYYYSVLGLAYRPVLCSQDHTGHCTDISHDVETCPTLNGAYRKVTKSKSTSGTAPQITESSSVKQKKMLGSQWDKVRAGRYDVNAHCDNVKDTQVLPFVSVLLMRRMG